MKLFGSSRHALPLYALLEAQATSSVNLARAFHQLMADPSQADAALHSLQELRDEADALNQQFFHRVDSTFVTPLDKEDLHALSTALDTVSDSLEAAASHVILYKISAMRPDMEPLTARLVQLTQNLSESVADLRNLHDRAAILKALESVRETEVEAEAGLRQAMAALFQTPPESPVTLLKWQDIYERTEKALDDCEAAANVLESIVVKYG